MREPDLILELLRETAQTPDGRLPFTPTMGMDEKEVQIMHHLEILSDSGHVDWSSRRQFPRITNAGYDFIEAVDKNPPGMKAFMDNISRGIPYIEAAARRSGSYWELDYEVG